MTKTTLFLQKLAIVSSIFVVGFTACEKKADAPQQLGKILFKHASPDMAQIDVLIDGKKTNPTTVSYSGNTGYLNVPIGSREIRIVNTAGTVLNTSNANVIKDGKYSLFVVNRASTPQVVLVDDVFSAPIIAGKAYVRLVNLVPDGLAYNVTLAGSNTNTFAGASFRTVTPFAMFDATVAGTTVTLQVRNPTTNAVVHTITTTVYPGKLYTAALRGFATPPTGNTNALSNAVMAIN